MVQERLHLLPEEECRHRIADRKEDIEFHPVGHHADLAAQGRQEVKRQPKQQLHPAAQVQFRLRKKVYDGGIEKRGQVPKLVDLFRLVKDIEIVESGAVGIGIVARKDLDGYLYRCPDEIRVEQQLELGIHDPAQALPGKTAADKNA